MLYTMNLNIKGKDHKHRGRIGALIGNPHIESICGFAMLYSLTMVKVDYR